MTKDKAPERLEWAEDVVGEILLTEEQIQEACVRLGKTITADYRDKDLLVVAILRGAHIFLADLIRRIHLPLEVDFMSVSSYGAQTRTTGVVRIIKDLVVPIEGKHLLIIEDVVDTGLTWAYLKQILEARGPASIRICSLLDKPGARKKEVTVDYTGFTIGDKFVVGYGLDLKERYRNLPFVMVPKKEKQK